MKISDVFGCAALGNRQWFMVGGQLKRRKLFRVRERWFAEGSSRAFGGAEFWNKGKCGKSNSIQKEESNEQQMISTAAMFVTNILLSKISSRLSQQSQKVKAKLIQQHSLTDTAEPDFQSLIYQTHQAEQMLIQQC
jgi:hypothetical protein